MREAFQPYLMIAKAISTMLRPHVEVIIHDLETETIAHIENPISKREIGDASLLHEIEYSSDADIIGPYEKINFDGRRIRSITVVLKSQEQKAEGLMCVNFDFSPFAENANMLMNLFGGSLKNEQPQTLFKNDWHEKINVFVSRWLNERHTTLSQMNRIEKKELVAALYAEGAFAWSNSATYISRILKLGRATVYKYVNEIKMAERK